MCSNGPTRRLRNAYSLGLNTILKHKLQALLVPGILDPPRDTPSGLLTTRLLAQHLELVVAVAEWEPSLLYLLEVESQLLHSNPVDTVLLRIVLVPVAPSDLKIP